MLTRSMKKQKLVSNMKPRVIRVGEGARQMIHRYVVKDHKLNGCTFRYLVEYLETGEISKEVNFFGHSRFFVSLREWRVTREEIKWLRENQYGGKDLAELMLQWIKPYTDDEESSDDDDDIF